MRTAPLVVTLLLGSSLAWADKPAYSADELKACTAKKGDVCLTIGQRYVDQKAYDKALDYYLKACDAKAYKGCGWAATLLMLGQNGVTKDEKKASALREKACANDDGASCNDIGTAWSEGKEGAPKVDLAKAKNFYERACKLKDGLGCFNLGNVYRMGEGVKVDDKEAFSNFTLSCDLGAAKGCTELAIMYYEGKGAAKDAGKAQELLDKACKMGSDVACKNADKLRAALKK